MATGGGALDQKTQKAGGGGREGALCALGHERVDEFKNRDSNTHFWAERGLFVAGHSRAVCFCSLRKHAQTLSKTNARPLLTAQNPLNLTSCCSTAAVLARSTQKHSAFQALPGITAITPGACAMPFCWMGGPSGVSANELQCPSFSHSTFCCTTPVGRARARGNSAQAGMSA